jgi:hypothetical protein
MKMKRSTDEAVARFLSAHHAAASARERHLYRESLHALVRLAKSELMMEMKANVRKLTAFSVARNKEKARSHSDAQARFEFDTES